MTKSNEESAPAESTEEEERVGSYVEGAAKDPKVQATARSFRRVGYVIGGLFAAWIILPIGWYVSSQAVEGQAFEPTTGLPVKEVVAERHGKTLCAAWADKVLAEGNDPKALPAWSKTCLGEHPVFELEDIK